MLPMPWFKPKRQRRPEYRTIDAESHDLILGLLERQRGRDAVSVYRLLTKTSHREAMRAVGFLASRLP